MDESTGKGVYNDNLFIHFPGIVDGRLCAVSGDFPTYHQKNARMIDHKFVAFHHTSFVVSQPGQFDLVSSLVRVIAVTIGGRQIGQQDGEDQCQCQQNPGEPYLQVPAAAKRYQEEPLAEVNADREVHGKKPLDDEGEPPKAGGKKQDNTSRKKQARRKKAEKKQKTVTVSTTDPECGMFHKGEHKRCFAYEAHTACDKNGYVLEAVVTPGNVHDSVAFDDVYDKLIQSFPEVETVVADAAYKTPHICKKVFRDGRVLSTAYKCPMTMKGGHPWWP